MGKKVKIVLDIKAHFEEKITFFGRKVNKVPSIIVAIWGKINFLGVFGVKHTGLFCKKVKIVLDMQAHFEEKIKFFGRKVNKVPCIIFAIWGKINFLGIFGVKTQWIIGQKSQSSARYAGAFWEKITFFGRKVNKVPCILGAIWRNINFLVIFGVKKHWIIGQKSQNSARYAGAFWEKFTFFGRKVNKVLCIFGDLRKN